MNTLRLSLFSMIVLVAVGLFTSCTARKDPVRAQDRVAIEQLMWEYIQALDAGDVEKYVSLFASDGQFVSVDTVVKGREALKNMMLSYRKPDAEARSDKKESRMYHVVTNPHIEFIDEDHARYHAYWMGALAAGGTTSAGREVNDLVRIDGKWLISVRDVAPKD